MEFVKTATGGRTSSCGLYYIFVHYYQPRDNTGTSTAPEEAIYEASYLGKDRPGSVLQLRVDRRDIEAKEKAARQCLAACDAHASKRADQPSG